MIKYLAEHHRVELVCLSSSKDETEKTGPLKEFCDAVDIIVVPRMASRIRALRGFFSSKPLTLWFFRSKRLRRLVERRLQEKPFDAILAFSSSMAQFIPFHRSVPRIVDFADVDSDKWFQYADHAGFPSSLVYQLEGKRLQRYERSLLSRIDACTVISSEEERLLRPYAGDTPLFTLPNGVDLDYFRGSSRPSGHPRLIFIGVMNYFANVNGVLYFHEQILPRIREEIPETEFVIVGGDPPPAIRRLGRDRNVQVTGYVRDIRPLMEEAAVCVVPLRIARGVQNKILEAMAMGLPVVTTSRALEGIDARPGEDIIVADDPGDFAARTVRLLGDPQMRAGFSRRARAFVESRYRWNNCLQKLNAILQTIPSENGWEK
jgi:sugar transferase (PEP-CTERM/EpsH1 system associated)